MQSTSFGWVGTLGHALGTLGLSLGLLSVHGCEKSSLPVRARVTGVVTLDGSPLTGGTILFVPEGAQGSSSPPAVGFIDPQGRYQLTTDRSHFGDGAVLGRHKVSIEARDSVEPGAVSKSLVPAAYGNPETSGLIGEVQAGRVNTIDFPLSSATVGKR